MRPRNRQRSRTIRHEMIVTAVQQMQGKKGEKEGDPLPLAEALAIVVRRQRGLDKPASKTGTLPLPEDLRNLLRCNQIGTDVEVVVADTKDPWTISPNTTTAGKNPQNSGDGDDF